MSQAPPTRITPGRGRAFERCERPNPHEDRPDTLEASLFGTAKCEQPLTWGIASPALPNDYTFTFSREDHTLGNLLVPALRRHPSILFAAYRVPHPLSCKFELRLRTREDSEKTPIGVMIEVCQSLHQDLDLLSSRARNEFIIREALGVEGYITQSVLEEKERQREKERAAFKASKERRKAEFERDMQARVNAGMRWYSLALRDFQGWQHPDLKEEVEMFWEGQGKRKERLAMKKGWYEAEEVIRRAAVRGDEGHVYPNEWDLDEDIRRQHGTPAHGCTRAPCHSSNNGSTSNGRRESLDGHQASSNEGHGESGSTSRSRGAQHAPDNKDEETAEGNSNPQHQVPGNPCPLAPANGTQLPTQSSHPSFPGAGSLSDFEGPDSYGGPASNEAEGDFHARGDEDMKDQDCSWEGA